MSTPRQVSYVQVNAYEEGSLTLGEIMGRAPVREIRELLDSDEFQQKGWSKSGDNSYTRTIHDTRDRKESIEVRIDGEEVHISRKVSGRVPRGGSVSANIEQAYNLGVNELLGKAAFLSMTRQIVNLGCEIVEEPIAEVSNRGRMIDISMKVKVFEYLS